MGLGLQSGTGGDHTGKPVERQSCTLPGWLSDTGFHGRIQDPLVEHNSEVGLGNTWGPVLVVGMSLLGTTGLQRRNRDHWSFLQRGNVRRH